MKAFIKYLCYASITLILVPSCNLDDFEKNQFNNNGFIKNEVSNERILSNYKYNNIGKIAEYESLYFYNRFSYNNEGRLIKQESAADPSMYSSAFIAEKMLLMTAKNSTISSYQIFKYDENKKLVEVENYFKMEDEFELRSKVSFELINGMVAKRNLHNEKGEVTQFTVYEYDNNGNVENEKYFTSHIAESMEPRLISKTTFKYDNKNNPFIIFNELGNPGLYTNQNNTIETNTIRHEESPGFDKNSIDRITYEYNANNNPTKVTTENSKYEYTY